MTIAKNLKSTLEKERKLFSTFSLQEAINIARDHPEGCVVSNFTCDNDREWIRFVYSDNSVLCLN